MMKKIATLFAVVMLATCIGVFAAPEGIASAMSIDEEYDQVFLNTLSELAPSVYSGEIDADASKELLYDINLDAMGFVYDFTVNGEGGYAIVINTEGYFEVAEIFFKAQNPYAGLDGDALRVYAASSAYLYSNGVGLFWAETGTALSEQALEKLSEIAFYSGSNSVTTTTEHIYYTTKNESKYSMAFRIPACSEVGGLTNACGPIAGGNLVQYFDRFKENLIADFTSYSTLSGYYFYKEGNVELDNAIRQLYTDMGTNSLTTGTTIAQFKSGLATYCTRQGYTVTFTSCMITGAFNYSAAKEIMQAGQPIVLFLNGWTVAQFDSTDNDEYLIYINGSMNHVMAGFGFKEITYSLTSGGGRIDRYVEVASGNHLRVNGFFNINRNTTIDDAYSVNIA